LTELLLVLAVISLLAAVITPVALRVREKSRLATCTANLNQIAKAVLMYAKSQGDRFPAMTDPKPPGAWWWYKERVKQYAGLTGPASPNDKVFACPSDRGYEGTGQKGMPFHANPKYGFNSYVFNGVTLRGMPSLAGRTTASVLQPARTLMVMEWTAHAPLSWHKSLSGKADAPFYCDAESVVAFVDGHVKMVKIYYDGMNAAYTRDPIPGYDYKYSAD
jgi:type II secretory pathway pseudopilin PulG